MDDATRAYIAELVAQAPEPTDEQVDLFARLFTPDAPTSDLAA